MVTAILRGALGGLLAALYTYIIIISTYLFNSELWAPIAQFILPAGCAVIGAVFLEKERFSKAAVSALIFILIGVGVIWAVSYIDAAGSISRLLYGVAAENGSGSSIFAIFAFNALASLLGIMIALLIGLINTVKIKRLIDSLEVKKSE